MRIMEFCVLQPPQRNTRQVWGGEREMVEGKLHMYLKPHNHDHAYHQWELPQEYLRHSVVVPTFVHEMIQRQRMEQDLSYLTLGKPRKLLL